MVALLLEVPLERQFLLSDVFRIEEGNGGKLERVIGAAVEERARLRKRRDEVRRPDYPAHTPAREAPVL